MHAPAAADVAAAVPWGPDDCCLASPPQMYAAVAAPAVAAHAVAATPAAAAVAAASVRVGLRRRQLSFRV